MTSRLANAYHRDTRDARVLPPGPKLLRLLLGDDIYTHVSHVYSLKPTKDADLACLIDLPQLSNVYVYGHAVTDAGIAHLVGVRELNSLGLSDTSASAEGIAALSNAKKLDTLSLGRADATDEKLEKIDAVRQLTSLTRVDAAVTARGIAAVARLPRLEELRLMDAPAVDDAAMDKIASLKNLRRLELLNCVHYRCRPESPLRPAAA